MNTLESRETAEARADHSPFDDTVDARRFYRGGKRQEILDELLTAIAGAIPIVTLTGDEGSGKTMLCRMLEQGMPERYVTVLFSRAVDSFEDIVRTVASRLDVEPSVPAGNVPGLLQDIAALLREREARLLIVFDEAERIYLASLERVRKMLDQINADGLLMQIVLSGRVGLHKNFKHLALCKFQEVEEKHFVLDPLSPEETFEYLNNAVQLGDQVDEQVAFTRETAEKIFAASRGNFREIKTLARDSLKVPGADTSFMALLDNVREVEQKASRPRRRVKSPPAKVVRLNKRYLAWGGGVVCAALVAFLFMRSGQGPGLTSGESSSENRNKIVISKPESVERAPEKIVELSREKPPVPPQTAKEAEKQKAVEPAKAAGPAVVEMKDTVASTEPAQPTGQVEAESTGQAGKDLAQEAEGKKAVGPLESTPPGEKVGGEMVQRDVPVEPAGPQSDQTAVVATPTQPVGPEKIARAEAVAAAREPGGAEPEKTAAPVETAQPLKPEKAQPDVASTEIAQPAESEKTQPDASGQMAQPGAPEKRGSVAAEAAPAQAIETERERDLPPSPVENFKVIKAMEIVKHRDMLVAAAAPEAMQSFRQEESKIAAIKLSKPVKIKTDVAQEQSEQLQRVVPASPPVVEPTGVQEAPAVVVEKAPTVKKEAAPSVKKEDANRVYSHRIAAGTPWLLGLKDDRYTVQLMVVTGSEDEKKLKEMLTGEGFKEQANKVYILKKQSEPEVKYVFFGEYKSMTEARNARNTIPKSLRNLKPYAMSVKGAVKKAQEDE